MLEFKKPVNIVGCCHLDGKNEKERQHIIDWLDSFCMDGEVVIFAGDTFDQWREKNFLKIIAEHFNFTSRIAGSHWNDYNEYYLLAGNHDLYLFAISLLNMKFHDSVRERIMFKSGDKIFHVEHGHRFDERMDDWRSGVAKAACWIANQWGINTAKSKPVTPSDPRYKGDYEEYVKGAKAILEESDATDIVLAHTHKTFKREFTPVLFEGEGNILADREKRGLPSNEYYEKWNYYNVGSCINEIQGIRIVEGEVLWL